MISLLAIKGEVTLPNTRDPESAKLAKRSLLQYIRCEPTRMYQVGPIASWLSGGYSLERVEALLEGLVSEGVLRHATPDELRLIPGPADLRQGYYLTPEGSQSLPPEDRSFRSR
jgi:hypothetical protein